MSAKQVRLFFFLDNDFHFRPHRSRYSGLTPNAVARIAYIASDLVLSVQPALGLPSEFSEYLHAFAANRASGLVSRTTPEVYRVQQLRQGALD